MKPVEYKNEWFIGWCIWSENKESLHEIRITKVPIKNKVKLLLGSYKTYVEFFAVDGEGNQINIEIIDEGVLGDNNHIDAVLL